MASRNSMFSENKEVSQERVEIFDYSSPDTETLKNIAEQFNLDLTSLASKNPKYKVSENIPAGTKINLSGVKPAPSKIIPKSNEYVVKRGDSIQSIADKFEVDVEFLKTYNELGGGLVLIGEVIKIPPKQPTKYVQNDGVRAMFGAMH